MEKPIYLSFLNILHVIYDTNVVSNTGFVVGFIQTLEIFLFLFTVAKLDSIK